MQRIFISFLSHVLAKTSSQAESLVMSSEAPVYDLEYILSKVPGYIYWKNTKSQYMGCNENLARFSGLSHPQEIVGKTDFDFEWGQDQAAQFVRDDQYVMKTGEMLVTEHVLPQKREDGKRLYVKTEKMPFYDKHGKVIGVLAIAYDITEQKDLEKKLILSKEKVANVANQAKTEFLYNMRHDIRTPFSGILGLAQCMADMEEDGEKKGHLSAIADSADTLLSYLNEILEFTQLESGAVPILSKPFDLRQLVESVLDTFRPAACSKQLALDYDYDDTPDWVSGDRFRVQRILINLLSNAIKFTESGSIKVKVSQVEQDKKNLILKIAVEDTGVGIPLEKQDVIFEKFSKIGSSYDASNDGIGLGLRAVKSLIDELEGDIFIKSKVGCGSKFSCLIPFGRLLVSDPELLKELV